MELRDLIENRWLHLYALSDEGGKISHYRRPGDWQIVGDVAVQG